MSGGLLCQPHGCLPQCIRSLMARMRHSKIADGRPLSVKSGRAADITGMTESDEVDGARSGHRCAIGDRQRRIT
jgi:hypothetical protein